MHRRRDPVSLAIDLTLGRKGGRDVVSPLDPDWSPELSHAPAAVPAQNASPFTTTAAVPAVSVPAPATPAPPAPYAVPDPTAAEPAGAAAAAASAPAGHDSHGQPDAHARMAIEEDSAFESGLLTELLIEVLE